MDDHIYKKIELVGRSAEGIEKAIAGAHETIRNLDWFEVKEIRGNIDDGGVRWCQVTVAVGFRVLSPQDLHAGD